MIPLDKDLVKENKGNNMETHEIGYLCRNFAHQI